MGDIPIPVSLSGSEHARRVQEIERDRSGTEK